MSKEDIKRTLERAKEELEMAIEDVVDDSPSSARAHADAAARLIRVAQNSIKED